MDTATLTNAASRLSVLIALYKWILESYPGEKTIIFSGCLKILDIVAEALKRPCYVDALRYDGTIPTRSRPAIEEAFAQSKSPVSILIMISSGGAELNIQAASIVIIAESQWNRLTELQVIGRAHRFGQDRIVKTFHLRGMNSRIDGVVLQCQQSKTNINKVLMSPLIRLPSDGPADLPLLTLDGINVEVYKLSFE